METPRGPKREPLPIDEAQKEASMLQAHMKLNPDTGRVAVTELEKALDPSLMQGGRLATAADYSAALAAVEELQLLSEQELTGERIKNILGRVAANSVAAAAFVADMLHTAAASAAHETSAGIIPPRSTKYDFYLSDKIDIYKQQFEDAAYRLRQLQAAAKKYGRS